MILKRIINLIMLTIIVFSSSMLVAFKNTPKKTSDVHSTITNTMNNNDVHSFATLYYKDGNLIHKQNSENINDNDTFEAGSLGKTITSYITLKMIDEGIFSLDDPIHSYINDDLMIDSLEFKSIKIRDLLSHTSGFSPSFELGIDKKIYFDPGSKFLYSGVGYIYLQDYIENITGKPFEIIAQKYVFVPLQMSDSSFKQTSTVTPYMNSSSVVLYSLIGFVALFTISFLIGIVIRLILKKKFSIKLIFTICFIIASTINSIFLFLIFPKVLLWFISFMFIFLFILVLLRKQTKVFYLSFVGLVIFIFLLGVIINKPIPVNTNVGKSTVNAAYTFTTSINDLNKFMDNLIREYEQGSQTMQFMFKPQVTIDKINSWSLGIGIETIKNTTYYWHSGINPGSQSIFVLDPKSKTYIIVLTNSDNGLKAGQFIINTLLSLNGKWEIPRN